MMVEVATVHGEVGCGQHGEMEVAHRLSAVVVVILGCVALPAGLEDRFVTSISSGYR